jgi:N-acetylglucosaminyldiphosphoundecaprenol N-acetyl-beta-D-mannosaminyltransferase
MLSGKRMSEDKRTRIETIIHYGVHSLNIKESVELILYWLRGNESRKVFVCANPHSLVEADKDKGFERAIKTADLVTADGAGIVLASKILGGRIRERVTGSNIFYGLSAELNREGGRSYFFLGSTEKTLAAIEERMAKDYPNIRFAGAYSPPYKSSFSAEENMRMIEAVNAVKPDVLWVGMTAPKQEKWIHENIHKLDVRFAGAIGAVFDFYVGNVKRSHPVFQKMGLEWLPRLLQEPRRLFKRNFVSSPLFLLKVFWQKISERSGG